MNYVRPTTVTVAFVVLLAALSGCNSTPVLRATFDADDVGAMPSLDLAGDPAGDTLWTTASSPETLSVVNDPVIGSRSAQFSNTGSLVRMVGFVPVALSSTADKVYAYWTGVVRGGAAPLRISLVADHFEPIGGLRFESGQVFARTPSGDENIGSYETGVSHVVVLTHDRGANTFNISILGRNPSSRSDIPVINETAADSLRPFLLMFYDGGSSDAQYVVDSVFITEKEPEM